MATPILLNIIEVDQLPITSTCNCCGRSYSYYGDLRKPWASYCSASCAFRGEEYQTVGYPPISDWQFEFWARWAREEKQRGLSEALARASRQKKLAPWLKQQSLRAIRQQLTTLEGEHAG